MQHFHKYKSRNSSSENKRNKFLALHIKNLQNSGRISIGSNREEESSNQPNRRGRGSNNSGRGRGRGGGRGRGRGRGDKGKGRGRGRGANNNNNNNPSNNTKKQPRRTIDGIEPIYIDSSKAQYGDDGYQNLSDENLDPNLPARRKSKRLALRDGGSYYTNKRNRNYIESNKPPTTPKKAIRKSYKNRNKNDPNQRSVSTPATNESNASSASNASSNIFFEDYSSGKDKHNTLIWEWIGELRKYFEKIEYHAWIIDSYLDQPDLDGVFHGVYDPRSPFIYHQTWKPTRMKQTTAFPTRDLAEKFYRTRHTYHVMSDLQLCLKKSQFWDDLKEHAPEVHDKLAEYCWSNYGAIGTNPYFATQPCANVRELKVN